MNQPSRKPAGMRAAELLAMPVALMLLPMVLPGYLQANEVVIYAIAVLGSALLFGYTGLMSFGQGAFYGMGAYGCGWVGATLGGSLPAMLLAGAGLGTLSALIVGYFSIRQRGVYFVMLTLAFAQLFYFLAYSFRGLTGGDNGMTDIPRPPLHIGNVGILSLDSPAAFYTFCSTLFLLAYFAVRRIVQSPFGTTLIAIRENENRACAIGNEVVLFKLAAFAFSGLLTGLAGALHASFLGIASLTGIDLDMSQTILAMTIIGGGTLGGSLAGPLFYIVLSSWLSTIWPRWPMLIGFILIAIGLYCPDGLWEGLRGALRRARRTRKTRHASN